MCACLRCLQVFVRLTLISIMPCQTDASQYSVENWTRGTYTQSKEALNSKNSTLNRSGSQRSDVVFGLFSLSPASSAEWGRISVIPLLLLYIVRNFLMACTTHPKPISDQVEGLIATALVFPHTDASIWKIHRPGWHIDTCVSDHSFAFFVVLQGALSHCHHVVCGIFTW